MILFYLRSIKDGHLRLFTPVADEEVVCACRVKKGCLLPLELHFFVRIKCIRMSRLKSV